MVMRRNKRSLGELISNLVFFFAGILLIFEGRDLLAMGQYIKGIFVVVGGFFSFIAAFRFKIQKLVEKWRG